MHLSSSTPHKKARIEIIPLIDIMFFLLASFMLVSMSMIKLQQIPNNLPGKSPNVKPLDHPDFTTVGIDKAGNFYFGEEGKPLVPIKASELPARLQPIYVAKQQDTKVFINVDKDAKYDALIAALDQVREIGISKVSFAVKKDHAFDPNAPGHSQVPVSSLPAGGPPANP